MATEDCVPRYSHPIAPLLGQPVVIPARRAQTRSFEKRASHSPEERLNQNMMVKNKSTEESQKEGVAVLFLLAIFAVLVWK